MGNVFKLQNGSLLLITEAPGGIYNSGQLKKIASLADNEAAIVKVTEDQRLALFVSEENASEIAEELKSMGLGIRHYQDGLHQPTCCIGELCPDAQQDALGSSMKVTEAISALKTDTPLRIGINGCSRCCVPCHTLDISIVGDENGYRISLGGKNSQIPEMATFMAENVPEDKLPGFVEKIITLYKEHAEKYESLQEVMERIGPSRFASLLHPYSQDAAADSDDIFAGQQDETEENQDLASEGLDEVSDLSEAENELPEDPHQALETEDADLALETEDADLALETEDADLALETEDADLALETEDADLALETEDADLALETEDADLALETEDADLALEADSDDLSPDSEDSDLSLETEEDDNLNLDAEDSDLTLESEDDDLNLEDSDLTLEIEEDADQSSESEDHAKSTESEPLCDPEEAGLPDEDISDPDLDLADDPEIQAGSSQSEFKAPRVDDTDDELEIEAMDDLSEDSTSVNDLDDPMESPEDESFSEEDSESGAPREFSADDGGDLDLHEESEEDLEERLSQDIDHSRYIHEPDQNESERDAAIKHLEESSGASQPPPPPSSSRPPRTMKQTPPPPPSEIGSRKGGAPGNSDAFAGLSYTSSGDLLVSFTSGITLQIKTEKLNNQKRRFQIGDQQVYISVVNGEAEIEFSEGLTMNLPPFAAA